MEFVRAEEKCASYVKIVPTQWSGRWCFQVWHLFVQQKIVSKCRWESRMIMVNVLKDFNVNASGVWWAILVSWLFFSPFLLVGTLILVESSQHLQGSIQRIQQARLDGGKSVLYTVREHCLDYLYLRLPLHICLSLVLSKQNSGHTGP